MLNRIFSIKLLVALLACLTIISCKKDDNQNSSLIVGSWKMTGYIHKGDDVFGTAVGPCVTDDITTFSNTNVVTLDEGPTKCNPADPQTITGSYSVNSNQTELTTTAAGSSNTDSILTLNSTTLKLKQLSNDDAITYSRLP